MLTPSRPSLANTTTMTPRALTPTATQRLALLSEGSTTVVEERFVQVSEIQPVFIDVGQALRSSQTISMSCL